ncbi:hypothetical protein EX895_005409 [Sporisorium graminicola]|uniref:Uncharacterized protein n=1 Tax=Sporisorium graminicola TaxID=280036 RepID=A0A4U7KRM5_9BASI|nr:hypothetical protein EX895_005409 [Sporisorium graminicola]TKY85868.1 hypothetical protein EX895_005409 [Sporisorium graminicola]
MSASAAPLTEATAAAASASGSKAAHHRRTPSLLPSFNSLGSFLASAGGLTTDGSASSPLPNARAGGGEGGLSTDAELMISDPTPTEWADEAECKAVQDTLPSRVAPRNNLSEEVRFRGQSKQSTTTINEKGGTSFIAFPVPESPTTTTTAMSSSDERPGVGSRASSAASSTARDSDTGLIYSPKATRASMSSSLTDTPATSVQSPAATMGNKELDASSPHLPPSESTVKEHQFDAYSSRQYDHQTLPRSFAAAASFTDTRQQGASHARTSSLSAATGRTAATRHLDDPLSSNASSVQRQAGFRARSIHSIRGLAAAWVPARFAATSSQPSSSASSSASSNDGEGSDTNSPRRRDALALTTVSGEKGVVRHAAGEGKRPVKLDRRRLDKAVSLAVEAAQAAEEDERVWEEKRRAKRGAATRPALQAAWSGSSRSSVDDNRQLARRGDSSSADGNASLTSTEEPDDEEDDLGFSLDLYISSLGYLISAISDKEAPGLSSKQRQDIRQRLEEGMAKLGFDAKAELAKAEAMKRDLELEREKLQLQQQAAAAAVSPQTQANVVHHHYHTAVPANSSIFGDGANFSRAHAAAKASSRGSSSLAGKISASVLDIGLHIGAGALSALSANLSAIAPRGGGGGAGRKTEVGKGMDDPRITDLDNDEDLQTVEPAVGSRRGSASQPASGTATPRTAWSRAISQNNKQWELAVAFASTAASALASSLGAVARSDGAIPSTSSSSSTAITTSTAAAGPLTREQQQHLAQWGHLDGAPPDASASESAEDRLILLSASLARALKRSPLPSQLYQLLRQLVSILAAIDARYSLTEKGTQMAVRETSRALRFVRRHDLHVKAVRVAWAAAEAAVAALEAYRDEKGFVEVQQQQQRRIASGQSEPFDDAVTNGMFGTSPPPQSAGESARLAIADLAAFEKKLDDAEKKILEGARGGKQRQKVERSTLG